ncbi:MAG: fascin domain-containing protein [Nitrospira sp.]
MRHDQAVALVGAVVLSVGLANCTTTEPTPADRAKVTAAVMEVPVIPDEPPVGHEPPPSESSGEVQEHGVKQVMPGLIVPDTAVLGGLSLPLTSSFPGEFAFRTQKGYYLTAINGGGRIADPIVVTSATAAGAWEKFKLAIATPPSAYDKTIQTASGNYLTAVNGGGMTANVLHTDATQPKDWERFRLIYMGGFPPPYYGIGTIKGNFLTAVGAGGRYQDAVHSDAKQIQAWEQFRIMKCGDPGSGYEYGVIAADGEFLAASTYEGKPNFGLNGHPTEAEMKFKLIRQGDGTYALQTVNGRYLTALGGGGQVEKYDRKYWTPDCGGLFGGPCIGGSAPIFHTDATQVQAWEKFRFVDQGNCTYTIQTTSGFFAGIFKDSSGVTLLTTRRDGAPTANEKFQLAVFGLASPPIIQ